MWDYPRPPRLSPSSRHVRVAAGGLLVADSRRAVRVLETSHPPTWYLPVEDVVPGVLRRSAAAGTVCEWKGLATYWDVLRPDVPPLAAAAWSYQEPTPGFASITGYMSFLPALLECTVDGEPVRPQDGGFYGGWITGDVVGPFKGGPGSWGW
ncbi:hypothetical protein GCM10011594_26300 [Nakamurella endophytica]|uniref:DUF427 domain-containing protein n=1 Tax=Nakamurella endophytica TaxID=1748367 RepID=A0A917T0D7_9ACTN|nr:DUF427 domain-containing protein [Nakamurella endophytica]GGM04794.1 hypothetical protein GCM10011594_26300 [Nakamurella endophytica]